jgi:hypothetical protein
VVVAVIARNPLVGGGGLLLWLASGHRHVYLWPPRRWRTTLRHLRGMWLRSWVWFAGLAVGSLKARRFVL